MLSQPKTRVQAIKIKFESLNAEKAPLVPKQSTLYKIKNDKENKCGNSNYESELSSDEYVRPNDSYLYKNDVKRSVSDSKTVLTRQSSDPGKKLHRSHAFRCDRTQISPKRHGSCSRQGMDRKLSKDKLKRLGDFLEVQMKKENFIPPSQCTEKVPEGLINSIPDENVPPHILAQYSKVLKPKRDEKQDAMTDSGVSSETENFDDDRTNRVRKLTSQFENDKTEMPAKTNLDQNSSKSDEIPCNLDEIPTEIPEIQANLHKIPTDLDEIPKLGHLSSNLDAMEDLAGSSETMKLERKNPHVILTDTLKKALKQPLPAGPPPKKPPRIFQANIEEEKRDMQRKLEKLEQVLLKKEADKRDKNIYDIAEENLSGKPKEIHYLCTEILDITQRSLLPNQTSPLKKCLGKLNCTVSNSTSSLPYTRLSSHLGSTDNLVKCANCQVDSKDFKCHCNCQCQIKNSEFYVDDHIYDEPCVSEEVRKERKSKYGTLNSVSKSMDDLREKESGKRVLNTYVIGNKMIPRQFSSVQRVSVPRTLRYPPVEGHRLWLKLSRNQFIPYHDQKIYDIPYETVPLQREEKRTEFQKILRNFETGAVATKTKSQENLTEAKFVKKMPSKFNTEVKRYKVGELNRTSNLKRNTQLDVDRENLNRLMNEIYDTVSAAYNMDDNKPGSFPTDHDGSNSEESVKLTRSLTEKRKNYVRRVSSRLAYLEPKNIKNTRHRHQTSICSYKSEVLDNPYSTFRSWKSFRASQSNLTASKMSDSKFNLTASKMSDSKFNLTDSCGNVTRNDVDSFDTSDSVDSSIDEKAGCVDLDLPFEPRENGLFNVCLLVGLNYMTGEAYVKSVFPAQVQVPQHIESLIFPETFSQDKGEWATDAKSTQCYSFVLTDERGERSYGYCRRVLPEGATTCLPLCYCLIGKYRAPGFYYKVLQEIESHHGSTDIESNIILQQLFESDFPNPGEEITITYKRDMKNNSLTDILKINDTKTAGQITDGMKMAGQITDGMKMTGQITDGMKLADSSKISDSNEKIFEDNNNYPDIIKLDGVVIKSIKRPLEPRADEVSLCSLLDECGAGLLVKMFATLLLERKLLIRVNNLSCLSRLLEGVQCVLYPFAWQQPLICCVPSALRRDVASAPVPLLAGLLDDADLTATGVDDGMLIDTTHPSKVLFYQGDESTILPTNSYKTLKTSLQMESLKYSKDDEKTRNVMISEAFLRFFVDILGDFWRFFSIGARKDGDLGRGNVVFDKDSFVKASTSKQNQYFLEWFTETAMFNHFIQNMSVRYVQLSDTLKPQSDPLNPVSDPLNPVSDPLNSDYSLIDTPTPNYYQLFEERVQARINRNSLDRTGYKSALNKRVKMLKARLKDLVG